MPVADRKVQKVLDQFFSARKVLVADSSRSTRVSITKTLTDIGAKSNSIVPVSAFEEARRKIEEDPPHLLVTDYYLDKRCGLELVDYQRKAIGDDSQRMFILCTSNADESTVAEAAEEDVDAYILKPFSPKTLQENLVADPVGGFSAELAFQIVLD